MEIITKDKKVKIYNFRISEKDLEKIKYIKENTDYDLPEMIRNYIRSVFEIIIKQNDIDDRIYQ